MRIGDPRALQNTPRLALLVRLGEPWGPIHDNCSGKHAGFICLACALGTDPQGYVRPDHVAQRAISAALADVTAADLGEPAVDGCSIPAYAIPLRNLALAFARMVTGEALAPSRAAAARRLIAACRAEPFMIAGSGRFDTGMQALFGPRLFIKGGAEGVYCGAVPELGLGIAIKCDDGAGRGAEVVVASVLAKLLKADAALSSRLTAIARPPVESRVGARVGTLRPTAALA